VRPGPQQQKLQIEFEKKNRPKSAKEAKEEHLLLQLFFEKIKYD